MNNFNYYLEAASTQYIYHVTDTKNVSRIKEKGLLMMQTSNWKTGTGKRYGSGEIYAFENATDAVRWAGKMHWDFYNSKGDTDYSKISILKIRKDKDDWEVDSNDPIAQSGGKGRWLKKVGKVEASDIVKVIPLSLKLTRKLVSDEDISL